MKRSYYQNTIQDFLTQDKNAIFGQLARHHSHALEDLQKHAWLKQIDLLKQMLSRFDGHIYFEFSIPRMGKRVDNILIINHLIFVIEFKVGDTQYSNYAQGQTIDYGLDLLNFHEGSHGLTIIPVLVATQAPSRINHVKQAANLESCILCNIENFADTLTNILNQFPVNDILNVQHWENSVYKPTPTIIEAAQALYKGHHVKDISRSDAGAINLSKTAATINRIIEYSKHNHQKSICFLTGVPGAGKTLAGLNIANARLKADELEHAVFLSGNGPLVEVLREALTRDAVLTAKEGGERLSRSEAARKAKSFIQNIHHFRDDHLTSEHAPVEKVVVFDEAQRAWQQDQVSRFMKNKKGIENFNQSEPEYLISVMDRHQDWCTIVCLIGGGQEINTGEAGVSEWISALKSKYQDWGIYYSDKILAAQSTYVDDPVLLAWLKNNGHQETDLHLAVSLRSFRSEHVALLIQHILENDSTQARISYEVIKHNYPVVLTRDFKIAKQWLRHIAKGTERTGVIASSGGRRLRAEGINVKNEISAADWFLNPQTDVRSCYYLEEIATEFDIQGLEIDYTCLAWDINLYYDQGWHFQSFKGAKWQEIKQDAAKKFLLNAYRVLLTRARQGMVIFVPEGNDMDWTRPKQKYDATFEYLKSCGFEVL